MNANSIINNSDYPFSRTFGLVTYQSKSVTRKRPHSVLDHVLWGKASFHVVRMYTAL